MKKLRILGIVLPLLLLWALAGAITAQEPAAVSVIGSAVVNALVADMADGAGINAEFSNTGSAAGIDQFCNGAHDMATAMRAMTAAERSICSANDIGISEFLVGHQMVALVAGADVPLECLSIDEIDSMLKPSASNTMTDWTFHDEENDSPLTLILPPDESIEYAILDAIVAGDQLRRDVATYADSAEALTLVGATGGAIAMLPWQAVAQDAGDSAVLTLNSGDGACSPPAAETVESGEYAAAQSLRLYVNRARLDSQASFANLMQYILDEANASSIAAAGITAPTSARYALNAQVLADAEARAADGYGAYEDPMGLSGELKIAGAANSFAVLNRIADRLSGENGGLEVSFEFAGSAAGLAQLCNGEADIATLDAEATVDGLAECEANGIVAMPLPIGTQATVVLLNAGDDYAACLSTEQVNRLWRADASESAQEWSQLDPAFPEQSITLFGLSWLGIETDILLQTAAANSPPVRRDTEKDSDPLYRAAAVANVPGALTYMTWQDYQAVLENEQQNIALAAVDAGAGCVLPAPASIAAGEYALARQASLLVSEPALADFNAQSFLWALFEDDSWSYVQAQGFIGMSQLELPILRRQLRQAFADAEAKFPPVMDAIPLEESAGGEDSSADSG